MASTSNVPSSDPARPNVAQPSLNNIIGNPVSQSYIYAYLDAPVNPTQRLNPILDHVKNVGKEFGEIVADYQVGRTTGVLFLR